MTKSIALTIALLALWPTACLAAGASLSTPIADDEVAALHSLPNVSAITGVRRADDQILDCNRAAVIDIKVPSVKAAFDDGFVSAQRAILWVSDHAEAWGTWQTAQKPSERREPWAREWRSIPACLQWIKVNIEYPAGKDDRGLFSVIWVYLGAEAGSLARLSPAGVIDASIFDGSNERAKIDIEGWCGRGGRKLAPRFCMASFINICRGHLYAEYARQCDDLGLH